MTPDRARHIFCIGIGGIGISGLAKIFFAQGKKITGVDSVRSELTDELIAAGVSVEITSKAEAVPRGADLVIYSEAVPFPHPQRRAAREMDIPEMSGAQAVAWLSKNKQTIAIAGTNGKSTTTALTGHLLIAGGYDPTVFLGSRVASFPLKNVRLGASDWFVLEADEYKQKLLEYHPNVAIITNIEMDHPDTYRDLQHLQETFDEFLVKLKNRGIIFINYDDPGSKKLHPRGQVVRYGLEPGADFRAVELRTVGHRQIFSMLGPDGSLGEFSLQLPGAHNVMNALAASACAITLGIPADTVRSALADFTGLWRRFETIGTVGSLEGAALIVSDYGHHPTAIAKTVAAAREFYPNRRIVLVYQPHQMLRTKSLFADFVKTLPSADLTLVSDIYDVTGRDDASLPVSAKQLVDAIALAHVVYAGNLDATEHMVREVAQPNDLVLVMGAGTIDEMARRLIV